MVRSKRRIAIIIALLLGTGVAAFLGSWRLQRGPLIRHHWCGPLHYRDCMVLVVGGEFLMGAQATDPDAPGYDPDAEPDEAPPHRVTVDPFYMDVAQVTAEAFDDCVRAGGCRAEDAHPGGGYFNFRVPERRSHWMNGVTWRGAADFCAWSGGRLPTEAEWEFAARGAAGQRFSWGDEVPDCDDRNRAAPHEGCPSDGTRATGVNPVYSPAGVVEMSGGVWEWVSDWYAEDWYARSPDHNPTGPEEGTRRVQRGGSWQSDGYQEMRGAYRASLEPDSDFADVGFRCARTPTEADGAGLFEEGPPRYPQ
ncbi:MAG: SUMF1/EgtB/PvdO family nonheme iron enzyme [Deltaproteobacteria bacterium]|nr:SUMF1/EgtB/PvdO family nonheme iron enzyme [Deltaproteobacteria bacterium]